MIEFNWVKIGGVALIAFPAIFAGIVLGVYLIQDYMIFLAEKLPLEHQYIFEDEYEELNFDLSDGVQINALLFQAEKPKGLVYYHHGNAGNIQSWGKLYSQFTRNGYDVLFYDYRGYGKSSGRIKKESQLHQDAAELLELFLREHHYDKLVLHGTSLGSGIAAKLASSISPDLLILETPYYSFTSLIRVHYPYLPGNIMSKYKLKTYKALSEVHCPIFIMHGTDDEIIPFSSAKRLLDLHQKINLVEIKGGSHNNLPDYPLYQQKLAEILSGI